MADNDTEFRPSIDGGSPLLRWREYLHVLYERRWIAITVFAAAVAGTLLWNERQVPLYRACARLQVDLAPERVLNIPDVVSLSEPGYLFQQYINTQIKAIGSRMFAEKVVVRVQAGEDSRLRRLLAASDDPAGIVLAGLSIEPVPESRLIDITQRHVEADLAAELANAVARQAVRQNLDRRMEASVEAVAWLGEQAETYRAKLNASELALQEFREDTGMVSLEQRQDIVVSKLKDVSQSLTEAEADRIAAQARWDEVRTLQDRGLALADIPSIRADPKVREAWQAVTEARNRVTSLANRYLAKHPAMIAAKAAAADALMAHVDACFDAAARSEAAYELAMAREKGLREALHRQESRALALDRKMMEYGELKRRAEADQELYQGIMRRMKETDLAGKLETTNIRIVDRARAPDRPFTPRKGLNLLRGSGAGLLLGLFLAFAVHFMDDRIRRSEDLELGMGVPVLAMVPRVDAAALAEASAVIFNESDSQAAEAFRALRAGILLNATGREARRIAVLSAGAAEGKSFVAANLAAAFAGNDQRTLLIDADMRRPTLHRILDLDGAAGLPDVLAGRVAWRDAVNASRIPLLDVLAGRGAGDRPAELLSSSVLAHFLDDVGDVYERVIIDSPPLLGVSDALLLLPHLDGVLFVAMYNRSHRRAVDEALHELDTSETPLLGAVINGVETGSFGYYYRRYGYEHYYGPGRDARRA